MLRARPSEVSTDAPGRFEAADCSECIKTALLAIAFLVVPEGRRP